MKGVQAELETCEPSIVPVLTKVERLGNAVIKVLNAWHKHGSGHLRTCQTYQTEMRWLRLGPDGASAQNPFPPFMRAAMFSLSQLHTPSAHFCIGFKQAI